MKTGIRSQVSGVRCQEPGVGPAFGIFSLGRWALDVGCWMLKYSRLSSAALVWTCALFLSSGCSRQGPDAAATAPKALATVAGYPVTEATFRYWWEKDTPGKDTPATREALLDRLIQRQTLVQRARASGLDQDPIIIEAIESLLIARLKEKELQPKVAAVEIGEEECRAFYEQNKDARYTLPERVRVAVLWFDTRGQELLAERYRPRLEQARAALLKDPESNPPAQGFGQLSISNTEHRPSRYRGGDVGWIPTASGRDPWRNAILEVAAALSEPGELSPVVVRPEGVFLVRLIERQPARVRALAEVRAAIEQHLKVARRTELYQQFQQLAHQDVDIHRFSEKLQALDNLPAPVIERTEKRQFNMTPGVQP
jgi:hypothetical protein